MSWKKTEPPKDSKRPVRLRYRDLKFGGKVLQGKFYWSDSENAWLEACDHRDGIGLYKEDCKILSWYDRNSGRKNRKAVKTAEKTLPALAFVFPYNELLLRGNLNVDGNHHTGVKTRRSNWNYRGPVLLYTSKGKPHKVPARAHNLKPEEFPNGVLVGVATVIDVRPLVWHEKIQITRNFNVVNHRVAEEMLLGTDGDYVTPMPVGVFLTDIRRFQKPIEFKPKPGAIGIMRVPIKQVAKALRDIGIDPKI